MKKVKFNNSRGLNIVASLYSIDSNKLIILAHGFMNDKSSNGRFENLSKSLNKIGYDTLAIDFSGCGESDNDSITLKNQVDDLYSAIDFSLKEGYEKIGLFGNSFGTLSCLKNYTKQIVAMVLVGPIMEGMEYDWSEHFSKEQMHNLNTKGFFHSHTNRNHKITKQTLVDFENINQNDLIKGVDCPILIVHGNNIEDKEELQLLKRSEKAINKMSLDSRIEIINDGRHGLLNHWSTVINITELWYNRFM